MIGDQDISCFRDWPVVNDKLIYMAVRVTLLATGVDYIYYSKVPQLGSNVISPIVPFQI